MTPQQSNMARGHRFENRYIAMMLGYAIEKSSSFADTDDAVKQNDLNRLLQTARFGMYTLYRLTMSNNVIQLSQC